MNTPDSAIRYETDEELVSLYREGADQDVRGLEELLQRVQALPDGWTDDCTRMREIVHNIKGQGSAFGYDLMTRVGNSLSLLLRASETVDERAVKLIAAHVSALRTVLDQGITGTAGDLGEKLASKLESHVEKVIGGES